MTIQPYDIPGFFPTSARVVKIMLEHADIQPGDSVLEPSAGDGAILDHLPPHKELTVYEIAKPLERILADKGYYVRKNFLQCEPWLRFDKIIMNPPFENRAARFHVEMAAKLMHPQGRLVSLVPFTDALWYGETFGAAMWPVKPGSRTKPGSQLVTLIVIDGRPL